MTTQTTQTPVETTQAAAPQSTQAAEPSSQASSTSTVETPAPTSEPAKVETPADSPLSEAAKEPAKVEETAEPEVEEYELELAEDSMLSEEDFESIAAEAERLNLTKDEAAKLLSDREALVKKGYSAAEAKAKADFDNATKEFNSAPEFSGSKREESFGKIHLALKAFGDPDLVKLMNGPMGSNVHLGRFLLRLGEKIAPEGAPPKAPGSPVETTEKQESGLKHLYPYLFEQKS